MPGFWEIKTDTYTYRTYWDNIKPNGTDYVYTPNPMESNVYQYLMDKNRTICKSLINVDANCGIEYGSDILNIYVEDVDGFINEHDRSNYPEYPILNYIVRDLPVYAGINNDFCIQNATNEILEGTYLTVKYDSNCEHQSKMFIMVAMSD